MVLTTLWKLDAAAEHAVNTALRIDCNDKQGYLGLEPGQAGQTRRFAFHDNEEIGPRMLARLAKATGLKPEDL